MKNREKERLTNEEIVFYISLVFAVMLTFAISSMISLSIGW